MQVGQRRRWPTGRGTYRLATVGAAASVAWLALTIITAGLQAAPCQRWPHLVRLP